MSGHGTSPVEQPADYVCTVMKLTKRELIDELRDRPEGNRSDAFLAALGMELAWRLDKEARDGRDASGTASTLAPGEVMKGG